MEFRFDLLLLNGDPNIDTKIFSIYKQKNLSKLIYIVMNFMHAFIIFCKSNYNFSNILMPIYGLILSIDTINKIRHFKKSNDSFLKFKHKVNLTISKFGFESMEEENCGICLEKLKKALKLPCGHCYHSMCLIQIIYQQISICPICRADIYSNQTSQNVNTNSPGNRYINYLSIYSQNGYKPIPYY